MHAHLYALARAKNRYVGDPSLVPTQRSILDFHWAIAMDGVVRKANVHVRADHAMDRGVPLPEGWRVALSANGCCGPPSLRAHRALDDCVALEAVVQHVSASLGIKPWELLRPFSLI